MKVLSRGSCLVFIGYVLNGVRTETALHRNHAYALRKFIEQNDGTIYRFDPA